MVNTKFKYASHAFLQLLFSCIYHVFRMVPWETVDGSLHCICKHLLEVVTFLKTFASIHGCICLALIKWDFMVSKYLILCNWNISLI